MKRRKVKHFAPEIARAPSLFHLFLDQVLFSPGFLCVLSSAHLLVKFEIDWQNIITSMIRMSSKLQL